MRFKTLSKILLGVTPAVILPITMTSCSVYADMLKDFTPSYSKLPKSSISKKLAQQIFFDTSKTVKDFVLQENYWGHHRTALQKDSGDVEGVPGLTYTSEFSSYFIHFAYINVEADAYKISYKITTDIQEDVKYHYEDGSEKWDSTGTNHYKVEWECKNLEFDVVKFVETTAGKSTDMILVKPVIYDADNDTWSRVLIDDEQINFNVRYIVEAYNRDGLQRYVYEATEAAVMDKTRSFQSELSYLIDYFCCFYSYYLSDCTLTD